MSYFEFLLFAHLAFVAIWIGTDVCIQIFALRARAAGPERMAAFMGDVEWMGLRVLSPTSLLVALFGVLMVTESDVFEFSQFWVAAGLAAFLLSAITGAAFLGPETGRIKGLMEARGPSDPEVERRIARIFLISRIELVILFFIIFDMVVKPGFP